MTTRRTELPPYSKVLRVRPEILAEEGLLDMVELVYASASADAPADTRTGKAKAGKRRKLSERTPVSEALASAKAFFDLTYPTDDIQQTLYALQSRLNDPRSVSGTIVLAGRYGLGKSHVLLAAHHALHDPKVARAWAERWSLEPLDLGKNVRVVTRSFIQRTAENLWQVFFEALGRPELCENVTTYPDGEQIAAALDDRPTFLILDELERWYDALPKGKKSRNRNFLQALTEVANRDARVTLVTSVLGEVVEPAETLRRVRPLELAFRSATDRQKVLLYRLFKNHGEADAAAVETVVDAYIDSYRRAELDGLDTYRQRMFETYPFTPEFLDILTKKVPNLGGFQNTRGSLRFLAKVVQATHGSRPMVSSQDLPFEKSDMARDLANLDDTTGGEIVRRALGDNFEAVPDTLAHKSELFSTLVFYSIADPAQPGASEKELLLAVLDPGENPNRVIDSLRQLRKFAFNLHRLNERFVFRTQENPHARIHALARSPQVTEEACRAIIIDTLQEAWGARQSTAVATGSSDLHDLRRELAAMGGRRPLYLIATRTLNPGRRLELQNLHGQRNLVLLIEPRFETERRSSDRYELTDDVELVEHARHIEACNRLLESKPDAASAAVYREVVRQRTASLRTDIAQRYGQYVSWHRAGGADAAVDDSWYELGRLDEFRSAHFLDEFRKNYSGGPEILDRLRKLWPDYRTRPARDLIEHFDRTPGEPVPYEPSMVADGLRKLAEEAVLGLQNHKSGQTYCRNDVRDLAEDDLPATILVEAPPISRPPAPKRLQVHPFVSASYDAAGKAVILSWHYPDRNTGDAADYETLVQRYSNAKGWETGKEYKLDLDRTHENNRYLGGEDRFADDKGLAAGARYYYYVFLVDKRSGAPRIALSQRCDVRIPAEDTPQPRDEIRIPHQAKHNKLLMEIERRVMSPKHMSPDSRVRKIEFELESARGIEAVEALAARLDIGGADIETACHLRFVVRGSFNRQQVLAITRKLPRLEAAYSATLYLAEIAADE